MQKLKSVSLSGFKSIRDLREFQFRDLNLMIGANGSGKSNLIAFFRMLSWMVTGSGNLQQYLLQNGGGSVHLFDGSARTQQIRSELEFETESGVNEHEMTLTYATPDTLVFTVERYRYSRRDLATQARWTEIPGGRRESGLHERVAEQPPTARVLLDLMKKWKVYQFHNTSSTARMRQHWDIEDGGFLKEDAANLAPFLLRMREHEPVSYRRITQSIRLVTPFFDDFLFDLVGGRLLLKWREKGSDVDFGAHQASDGTLRFMALAALLLQPVERLPDLLIIDEPELGLHPLAISHLSGMLKAVSQDVQVLVATQSAELINHFEPEDLIVVERKERESLFRRPSREDLQEWLEEYSMAELWDKNVLGGRPQA